MIKPTFEKNNIPVIFSSDNNYIKYLIVSIQSLICNSSKNFNYDIYIIDDDISDKYKILVQKMERKNVKITFIDIKPYLENLDLSIFHLKYNLRIATYYRFFVPRIFKIFEKAIYIDCDTVILDDVAKLFQINFEDNMVIATKDIGIVYHVNEREIAHIDYLKNKLKLSNPNEYLQAGVLVFDIQKLLDFDAETKFIEKLKEIKEPMYPDQDILNKVLENKIKFISQEWDILWHIPFELPNYEKVVPKELSLDYNKGFKKPKILHLAGWDKPWLNIFYHNAHLFWKYAIISPVFCELLSDLIWQSTRRFRLLKIIWGY